MNFETWNRAIRESLAAAREAEPTDAEVARVLAIDAHRQARPARGRRLRAVALPVCAVAVIGGIAAPSTFAEIGDAMASVAGKILGTERPGEVLSEADNAPEWILHDRGASSRRLVAESGNQKLYAVYHGNGDIEFGLGAGVGVSDTVQGWSRTFGERALVLLGPAAAPTDASAAHKAIFGLTAEQVQRVVLRYAGGSETSASVGDGGFVVLGDARRKPVELVGFDGAGKRVASADVSSLELRSCQDERGCPPGRWLP